MRLIDIDVMNGDVRNIPRDLIKPKLIETQHDYRETRLVERLIRLRVESRFCVALFKFYSPLQ